MSAQDNNNNAYSSPISSIDNNYQDCINLSYRDYIFSCDCGDLLHILKITCFDKENSDDLAEQQIFINIIRYNWRNFAQRFLVFLKYIFFDEDPYDGVFDVTILNSETIQQIENILTEVEMWQPPIPEQPKAGIFFTLSNSNGYLMRWWYEKCKNNTIIYVGLFFGGYPRLLNGIKYLFTPKGYASTEEFPMSKPNIIRFIRFLQGNSQSSQWTQTFLANVKQRTSKNSLR